MLRVAGAKPRVKSLHRIALSSIASSGSESSTHLHTYRGGAETLMIQRLPNLFVFSLVYESTTPLLTKLQHG